MSILPMQGTRVTVIRSVVPRHLGTSGTVTDVYVSEDGLVCAVALDHGYDAGALEFLSSQLDWEGKQEATTHER